jgi:hypothetical protein
MGLNARRRRCLRTRDAQCGDSSVGGLIAGCGGLRLSFLVCFFASFQVVFSRRGRGEALTKCASPLIPQSEVLSARAAMLVAKAKGSHEK